MNTRKHEKTQEKATQTRVEQHHLELGIGWHGGLQRLRGHSGARAHTGTGAHVRARGRPHAVGRAPLGSCSVAFSCAFLTRLIAERPVFWSRI